MSLCNPLDSLSKAYSSSPELQSIVAAAAIFIPGLNLALTVADKAIAGHGSAIVASRLELLLSAVDVRLSDLEKRALDQDFLRSDEWFDIVLKAIDQTARTRSRVKTDEVARILVSILEAARVRFELEDYLSAVSEMSEKELLVARKLYQLQKDHHFHQLDYNTWLDQVNWSNMAAIFSDIDPRDLNFVFARIARTGLISELTGAVVGYKGGVYRINDTFRTVMGLLHD